MHDLTYDNVTFTGGGGGDPDVSGVIEIYGSAYNITFRNCTIRANSDGVGNGVKIVDTGSGIHDITFQNCLFLSQPRMGFECIGRGSGNGYQRVNLVDCTFELQGSEAISYDDDSGTAGNCLISGNVVKGAGIGTFSWKQGFEINGVRNMTVTSNAFYACKGDVLNLQMHTTADCGWVFTDNVVNAGVSFGSPIAGDSNPIYCSSVYGGTFARNSITGAAPSWCIAYMTDCHNMDWRTSTWSDARGSSFTSPYQVSCTGNLF